MIFEERFCDYCRRRIAKRKRADARFCSHRCKLASHRQRARQAQSPSMGGAMLLAPTGNPPPDGGKASVMKQLAQQLVQHAPTGAVGYRLGEQFRFEGRRAELWFYPPSDRPFIRHDGKLVHRPYFLLRPFEPPVVPVSGPYGVQYIGADGTKFPMVLALAAGVRVEAGPHSVQLEDGERE